MTGSDSERLWEMTCTGLLSISAKVVRRDSWRCMTSLRLRSKAGTFRSPVRLTVAAMLYAVLFALQPLQEPQPLLRERERNNKDFFFHPE